MELDVLVFYVPVDDTKQVLDSLFAAGAGKVGNYDSCAFVTTGRGQFRPLQGANPTLGRIEQIEYVVENRVELVFPRSLRDKIVTSLRQSHPYEEPAFHVIENAAEN